MRFTPRRRTIFCVLFVLLICLDIIAGPTSTTSGKVESNAVDGGSGDKTHRKRHKTREGKPKVTGEESPKRKSIRSSRSSTVTDVGAEVEKEDSSKMGDTSKAAGAPKPHRVKSSHHHSRRHSSSRRESIEVTDRRTVYYSGPRHHPLIPKDQNGEIIFTAQGRDRVTAIRKEPIPVFGTMLKLFGLKPCTFDHSYGTMTPREARELQKLADVRDTFYDYKGRRVYRLMQQAAADEAVEKLIKIKNKEIQDAVAEGKKNVAKANKNTVAAKQATEKAEKEVERLKKELGDLEKQREEDKAKHEREKEKAVADARQEVQGIWMEKMDDLRAEFEGRLDTATNKQDTIREEYEKRLKDLQASFDTKESEYKAEFASLQKRIDKLREENDKDKKDAEERLKMVLLENEAAKRAAEDRVRVEEGEKHKLAMAALQSRSEEKLERELKKALIETQERINKAEAAAKNIVDAAEKERDKNRIQHSKEQIEKLEIEGKSRDQLHEFYANKVEANNAIWIDILAVERKQAIDRENQIKSEMTDAQKEAVEAERKRGHEAVEQVRKEWLAALKQAIDDERQRSISELRGAKEEYTSEEKAYKRRIEELEITKVGLQESLAQLKKALDEKEAYDAVVPDDSASNVSATTRVSKPSNSKSKPENPRVAALKIKSEAGARKGSGEKRSRERSSPSGKAMSETGKSGITERDLELLQASLIGAKNAGIRELFDALKQGSYVDSNKDIVDAATGVDMAVTHRDLVNDMKVRIADVMTDGHQNMTNLCARPQGTSEVSSIHSLTHSKIAKSDASFAKQFPLPSSKVGKVQSDVSVRTSSTDGGVRESKSSRTTPAASVASKKSRSQPS